VRNFFNYSDPAAGLNFKTTKIIGLTISGNHAQFSGTAKISRHGSITFTVNVDDFVGCPDQFSIQASNGYSAAGEVTNGEIAIHN
jgi:hypothetical protein